MNQTIRQSALSYIKSRPESVIKCWIDVFKDEYKSDKMIADLLMVISGMDADLSDVDVLTLAYVMKEGDE